MRLNLLLAGRATLRIQVSELQCCEHQLNWCRRITIWCLVHDTELHLGQALHHLRAVVPACIFQQESCVLLPAGRLTIQLLCEVLHECDHHITVGVGLVQGAPYSPFSIECSYQR